MTQSFRTTTLGYPRVGSDRAYKIALEEFWKGMIDQELFLKTMATIESRRLVIQRSKGIDLVACGDFSFYDHILDTAVSVGCIPERFGWAGGPVDLQLYFALARGKKGVASLELTKWFNTNYHYLVPEVSASFRLVENRALSAFERAQPFLGTKAKPVLIGPYTFLKLAKLSGSARIDRLVELSVIYREVLQQCAAAGVELVQIDEPALVGDVSAPELDAVKACYETLAESGQRICLQTYYGDVAPIWDWILDLPVAAIGLDLITGYAKNREVILSNPPKNKELVLGIVDGRNIWRSDLAAKYSLIQDIAAVVPSEKILLAPSCSLLHLPETVTAERQLPADISAGLCFAQERLEELALLSRALQSGIDSVGAEWQAAQDKRSAWLGLKGRTNQVVRERVDALRAEDFNRPSFAERKDLQAARLQLPALPTTTIGSFPQTPELRKARAHAQADPKKYQAIIEDEIRKVIALQEEIGLDVLVDGEPDRSDMVEFFAAQLPGCAILTNGWVQSYGSRCLRPPIIYGDVYRDKPWTLQSSAFAQSLTKKHVKGMLTGPVTILEWSYVRDDIPRQDVAFQIALAVRDETQDLEKVIGLGIIQIDEPAFREGLPLRKSDWQDYLSWAVKAFQLASSGVSPHVQIHTHMCYANFEDVLQAIADLNADVISIEDARSHGEMLAIMNRFQYEGGVGPGVWDIHSPQVPTTSFIAEKIRETLKHLPLGQVWINPDCGLKTRTYAEVIPSLKCLVEATKQVRLEL